MADTVRKRKPIAGGLWGLSLGLGLGLLAINAKLIDFAIVPFVIVTVIGIAIGVLWGMFGPAKKPKGPPPTETAPALADEVVPIEDEGPAGTLAASAPPDATEPGKAPADAAEKVADPVTDSDGSSDAPGGEPRSQF